MCCDGVEWSRIGGVCAGEGARRAWAIGDSGTHADGCGVGGARPDDEDDDDDDEDEDRQGRTGLSMEVGLAQADGEGRSEATAGDGIGIGGIGRVGRGGGGIEPLRLIALGERETDVVENVADGMSAEEREGDAAGSSREFMRRRAAQGSRVSSGEVEGRRGRRTDSETTRAVRAPRVCAWRCACA